MSKFERSPIPQNPTPLNLAIPQSRIKKNSKQLLANVINSAEQSHVHQSQQSNIKYNANLTKNNLFNESDPIYMRNKNRYQASSQFVQFSQNKQHLNTDRHNANRSRQKYSNVQSHLFADTSRLRQQIQRNTDRQRYTQRQRNTSRERQRLNTDQLIPSFRQKYQIYQLMQQITEYKRIIDIKNKQIFYLSNQIVSNKDEHAQKIIQLQAILTQNKRQLTELRYNGLKSKRQQSQKCDKTMDDMKKNYQLQIHQLKQMYQQLLQKQQQKHKKQLQNMQEKLHSILKLQKRQKHTNQQLYTEKTKNYQQLIKQLQLQICQLHKQKQQIYQQNNRCSNVLDSLKQEFKGFSLRASQEENTLRIEVQNLISKIGVLENNNLQTVKNYKKKEQETEIQIQQLNGGNLLLQQEVQKLKKLLTMKDRQLTKLIGENNNNQIYQKQNIQHEKLSNLNPIRNCNHLGLIYQLQKNIQIKNKQNEELKQQLQEWGKYIGFDRSCQDRGSDLLNASSEALQAQQNFSSTMRKKLGKYGLGKFRN